MSTQTTLKDGNILTVRPLTEDDALAAISLMHAVCAETDFLTYEAGEFAFTEEQERAFLAATEASPHDAMFGGFVGGVLVGTVSMQGETKARLKHNCLIGISVRKAYWGVGVGSAFLSLIIEEAKKLDVRIIHLKVNALNERGIHLYKKFGFETVGCHKAEMFIQGVYQDTLLMDLHL